MESDKKITTLNQEITEINNYIQNGIIRQIIASALIIKYQKSGITKKNNCQHTKQTAFLTRLS